MAACLDRSVMPSNAAIADLRYNPLPPYNVRIATWIVRTLNADCSPRAARAQAATIQHRHLLHHRSEVAIQWSERM